MEPSNLPPQLLDVFRESVQLGARAVTVSADGTPTLRILLEPEPELIAGLRVFLAHATKDREWADRIHDLLQGIGFKVSYLRIGLDSVPSQTLSEAEISRRLEDAIDEADYLCMLFTENSKDRDWVRFEFRIAARLIGRVLLLHDSTVCGIEDFRVPQFERAALLTVKHQVLTFDETKPDMAQWIARFLINDPDEGVTDGRARPLTIRERNLKKENFLRRWIRVRLDEIPKYRERHVVDILPFLWSEVGVREGNVRGVFQYFVAKHGRLNLEVQAALRKIEVSLVCCPVEGSLRKWVAQPMLFGLVVWKKHWDEVRERYGNRWLS